MDFPFKLPSRYSDTGKQFDGGQGSVFICKDSYLDRLVAIKVFEESSDTSQLMKEVAAIQKVKSRHIAQIYDVISSQKGNRLGIVQEFVPGQHVSSHFKPSMPLEEYIKIIYQIACGLFDIHHCGVVHRDVKPSNIKLDAEHVVKLLDFGLSAESRRPPITHAARGTPYFLAPEMYGNPPIKYTAAVDVFGFGVTARAIAESGAMLPGFRQTPPFANPLPDFANCKIALPQEVVQILNQTLESDPQKRPDIEVLRNTLERRLLYGKHRAVVTYAGMHELSVPGNSIKLRAGFGEVTIKYDGLVFMVESISGDVFLNNKRTQIGSVLPDSCVITLGAPSLGAGRTFAPFNVSHPGVVL